MYFDVFTVLTFCLIGVFAIAYLRLRKKKNFIYILFFTLFFIYLYKVLDYTLFQFQSLVILKYFMPNLLLRGQEAGKEMNLIPLITLSFHDLRTSFLNILLFVPFGIGLPFITNVRIKKVVVIGALFSMTIELLQLMTGYIADITFRVADVNDVIFNTIGVAIGYALFLGVVHACRNLSQKKELKKNSIVEFIAKRPQAD